jgi:hypothetical protein
VFGVHTKQRVISVLGVACEIKKIPYVEIRLSVRRETFFRFMKFSIGVQSCRANIYAVQFCSVTVTLSIRSLMKFYAYFPYFLTDVGEIWCNRCIDIPLNSCHVNHCSGSHTYECK